jgi:tetratricopeptide (TPR) repeat protein
MDTFWTALGALAAAVTAASGLIAKSAHRRHRLAPTNVHSRSQPSSRPAGTFLPAPIPEVVIRGRDALIAELAALSTTSDKCVHVLTGLGGCGKSTVAEGVAIELTRRGQSVWWISATDSGSVSQSLLSLARELGASVSDVQDARAGRVNPSDILWRELELRRDWTLVLDNADELPALVSGKRTAASGTGWLRPTSAGLVLVTSRVQEPSAWGASAQLHHIEPLSVADGAHVLLDLAADRGTSHQARHLAERLGGLPLALHQAGTYLRSRFAEAATFAGYEEALTQHFAELFGVGDSERSKITGTWELSLAALEAHAQAQPRQILRVLACFAPSVPIRIALLLYARVLARACGGEAKTGLDALFSVGLIDVEQDPDDSAQCYIRMHRLVAETTRLQAGPAITGALALAVEILTAAATDLRPDDRQDSSAWFELLPHLTTVLAIDIPLSDACADEIAKLAGDVCKALTYMGSYVSAMNVAESAADRLAGLPADREGLFNLRVQLASVHRFRGQFAEAEAEFRQILQSLDGVLEPDHPNTLLIRHHIAVMLNARGLHREAEVEFRQLLQARLRVLGADDLETLATRHNLALAMFHQGKAHESAAEFRESLDALLRLKGPNHAGTLINRLMLTVALARSKAIAEAQAEVEYRSVLEGQTRALGLEHPETLATRHYIGLSLAAQSKLKDAVQEFEQVRKARIDKVGAEHPSTLHTEYSLASTLLDQGKVDAGRGLLRHVLEARTRVLGPEHPDTIVARHRLAEAEGK